MCAVWGLILRCRGIPYRPLLSTDITLFIFFSLDITPLSCSVPATLIVMESMALPFFSSREEDS